MKKRCIKCGIEKDLSEFYVHPQMGDGLQGIPRKTPSDNKSNCIMEQAISVFRDFPSGKAEIERFSEKLKAELLECDLRDYVKLKEIQKTFEAVLDDKDVDQHFITEMEKYGKEKDVQINGAVLNIQETGVKYAYQASGDVVWNDLNRQITELTEKRKARENFLKALPEEGSFDVNNGNRVSRPAKTSRTKVVCRFK